MIFDHLSLWLSSGDPENRQCPFSVQVQISTCFLAAMRSGIPEHALKQQHNIMSLDGPTYSCYGTYEARFVLRQLAVYSETNSR
jgi:hypothetical protein